MQLTDEQQALLDWGALVRRSLPWRETRDPWSILVSEVMAQQTQVDRVIPKWVAFLARWPNAGATADAQLGDVLEIWQGLGYPRRAKALHDSARVIVDRFGGDVPANLEDLLTLPGVGPYTARAVLAFAFEQDVGLVDTNIARVIARRAGASQRARAVQQLADEFVPPGEGWSHNQSLMDLGAALCRPIPLCTGCPLALTCEWFSSGRPTPDPAIRSAGVSTPQPRFEGSDRQGRGRILRAVVRNGPQQHSEIAEIARWQTDPDRAERVLQSLCDDGLVAIEDGWIRTV